MRLPTGRTTAARPYLQYRASGTEIRRITGSERNLMVAPLPENHAKASWRLVCACVRIENMHNEHCISCQVDTEYLLHVLDHYKHFTHVLGTPLFIFASTR